MAAEHSAVGSYPVGEDHLPDGRRSGVGQAVRHRLVLLRGQQHIAQREA
jgi:hypothetical protein